MLVSEFSVSARPVLQLQLPAVSVRSTTILDAESNVVGEVEVLKYTPVDTSVYYESRDRHGVPAIVINRTQLVCAIRIQESGQLGCEIRVREFGVIRARVRGRCIEAGSSSAVPEVKNKYVLINIGLDDAETRSLIRTLQFLIVHYESIATSFNAQFKKYKII